MEIKCSDVSGDLPWCIVLLWLFVSGQNTETNFIILKQNKNNTIITTILERNSVAFLISAVISHFTSCIATSSSGQPSQKLFRVSPLILHIGPSPCHTWHCDSLMDWVIPVICGGVWQGQLLHGPGDCPLLWRQGKGWLLPGAQPDEKLGGRQGDIFFWPVFCHPLTYQTPGGVCLKIPLCANWLCL